MKKINSYIKILLIIFSFWAFYVFFNPEIYKQMWTLSWFLLIFIMIIRPLKDIFSKCKLFWFLLKFRREFWIIVWTYWLAHVVWYFLNLRQWWITDSYLTMFLDKNIWTFWWFLFWGMLWAIVCVPLLITSNNYSVKILWKHWKNLQRLSYFMFVFVALHIAVLKHEILVLLPVLVWLWLFVFAYYKNKKLNNLKPRWLCVPCWYIYDEEVWDIDSWIMPWTKFEDIPDDWRCPWCWVSKADFVLLWDKKVKSNVDLESKITSIKFLTDDVFELKLTYKEELDYIPGQFVTFKLKDKTWDFSRSYSVADKVWKELVFLIKIKPDWRAWNMFRDFKVWQKLFTTKAFWVFKLKNNDFPKVFIATWTWLAPIYSMALNSKWSFNEVFFWVAYLKDLFYKDELERINNLKINLFLSRENIEWYNNSRVSLEWKDYSVDTEFYICWSSAMIKDMTEYLKQKWYTKIYSEAF